MRRLAPLVFALLAFPLAAQDRVHQDLAALGRIWGIARYAHPWIGSHDIDLDTAALHAIDRVRDGIPAGTAADEMLAVMHDDATFVAPRCTDANLGNVDRSNRLAASGVVYISVLNAANLDAKRAMHGPRAAIVDLRPQPGRCSAPGLDPELVTLLYRDRVALPSHRMTVHRGYRSQTGASPFSTTYILEEEGAILPESDSTIARVAFVVDEHTAIPAFAAGLAAQELAEFVSVGRFPLHTAVHFSQVALPNDNRVVTVRTSELVEGGSFLADPSPRITLDANATDDQVRAAALQLTQPRSKRRASNIILRAQDLSGYDWERDETNADTPYPDVEHRILGAFRLWNIIQYFAGDRDSVVTWDEHLMNAIARVEAAQSRSEYELALAEIMTGVPDNQARIASKTVEELRGAAAPPFQLLAVEGKPVVVQASGNVKPGDELLRIDGRDVAERLETLERYAPRRAVMRDLAKGEAGSQSVFTFRRPDGSQYDVTLPRGTQNVTGPTKAWRMIDGNVALVDMSALKAEDVQTMLDEVASARAIAFDLRNGSAGAGEMIATRLIGGQVITWLTRVPLVAGGSQLPSEGEHVIAGTNPVRVGRMFALVDARVEGDAERDALILHSLGARVTGTPTAGASGTTSALVVPGNIPVEFTASDVRLNDARRLQSVGLPLDYDAAPTIHGLGDGRDEVLEAALATLD